MNIATYQTTSEKHGGGTFSLQIVDTICILQETIWHIMVVCVLAVYIKGYRQHCILEVLKKQISIVMRKLKEKY